MSIVQHWPFVQPLEASLSDQRSGFFGYQKGAVMLQNWIT